MEIRLHTISYAGLGRKVTTLKRLLILSDSHRFIEPMVRAVEHVKPDYIFHLGDLSTDAQQLAQRVMQIPSSPSRETATSWIAVRSSGWWSWRV